MSEMQEEKLWKSVPKYSTRDNRGTKDDVVKILDDIVLEIENTHASGSTENKDAIRLARLKYIKRLCGDGDGDGVVHIINNNIYGVNVVDIVEGLKKSNLSVIISDFHAISALRNHPSLQNMVKVMYIASTIDERELLKRYKARGNPEFDKYSKESQKTIATIQKMRSVLVSATRLHYLEKIEEVLPLLNEEWDGYVPYFETIKTRAFNIRMLYNRYIDNISLIDYPLLNFYDLDYMFQQARNILTNPIKERLFSAPPVFMVCAATSSGKKTLMEIVGDLGEVNKNISITRKYAKRKPRPTDGRDGMIAINPEGVFTDYIADPKDVWSWKFHNGTVEYAVNHKEIRDNILEGNSQVFISNMGQIEQACAFYPNNIVVLYLHATHETSTKNHICEKRLNEIIDRERKNKSDFYRAFLLKHKNPPSHIDETMEFIKQHEALYKELLSAVDDDLEEIHEVHYDFVKNNKDINHVLLNTGTREDLIEQMNNLIKHYS